MITKDKILGLLNEKIEGTDAFIVTLEINPGNKIYIEVDSMEGLKVEDIIAFSRQVEHNLDRDEEDFALDVSSPGLGNAYKVHQQYVKNIGRNVNVLLQNDEKFEGELKEVSEETISIFYQEKQVIEGKKKKQLVDINKTIPFADIKETKTVISFK